jgi:ATP-binding cassette, subfamily B, bacterial PglK
MKNYISDLKNLIYVFNVNKKDLIFILFLILLSSIVELISLGLVIPLVSQFFGSEYNFIFNNFFENYPKDLLIKIFGYSLIFIFFLKGLISIFIKWYVDIFSLNKYSLLQKKLIKTYQNMPYENFIFKNNSEYIRNIRELGSDTVSNFQLSARIIAETIVVISIILFLAIINFQVIATLSFFFILILFIYLFYLKPMSSKLGKIRVDAIGNIHKYIDNGIRSMKEMKVLKKDKFFSDNLFNYANIIKNTQKKAILINDSPRYVIEFFLLLFCVILVISLYKKDQNLTLYLPFISVYLLAGVRLLPSFSIIITSLNRVAGLSHSTNLIYNDLKKFSEIETNEKFQISAKNEKKEINSIEIKNLDFVYQNSKTQVFKNLNFKIKKNHCIGIVGTSGSGKTTFVDLLLGLLKPTNGKILINNEYSNDSFNLFGLVGYLPQEPLILEESVRTNISLEKDKSKIDYELIINSIRRSNFENVLSQLPNGLETKIGEEGVRFSGGQNKRLALARTFYHGKNFLIIDEATSSLDLAAEDYIATEIKNLKGKATIIIISHSKNILKYCDKIYQVKNLTMNKID